MKLPDRYKDLAARCDPLLAQMGMPVEQREEYLADMIGLVGQALDAYFAGLTRKVRNTDEAPRQDPPPSDP